MRVFVFLLALAIMMGVPLICGFSLLETVIILILGIFSLGFVAWIVQGFKPNLIRCVLFWWIANLFNKPGLLYPD